jgi:putative ABC transport system substrate-binding protein
VNRREFITLFGGAAAAWPLVARAQQPERIWRLGMLETTSLPANAANVDSFRKALRELGYVEGRNLLIEYRSADGRAERFPQLAAELLHLKVDLIVARGTPAALASKNASSTIPVVTTALANPFSVVTSLARPGGNVTGLSSLSTDLHSKRVELMREMVPGIARIAVLFDLGNPNLTRSREEIETGGRSLGIQPQFLNVRKPQDIGPAFDDAAGQHAEALLVGLDTLTQANAKLIVELAAKHRLPALYTSREFVDLGGLISFGVSYPDLYRRAATYVDKILKGTKPADLPVEQPTKFELVINLKTAKALGLTVPPMLLARADEVIE